ncbi:MAG TPA: TRAP transporter small permease [Stellaceae bacterium]|nr:TRAP transporter small permease [Stellaceae bacterium]
MLDRVRRGSDQAIKLASIVLLALLLICVTLGVVTRALNDPLIWTDEVSRFLMIWLAVLGWLLASRHRAHIRIRVFTALLPAAGRRIVEIAVQLAVAVFGALIVWYGRDLVARNIDIEATTVPVPMAVFYVPIVLAGIVTVLQAVAELWELVRPPRATSAESAP